MQAYITDSLRMLTENTAWIHPKTGRYMAVRYIEPKKQRKTAENRSGDEIADDIIGRLTNGCI